MGSQKPLKEGRNPQMPDLQKGQSVKPQNTSKPAPPPPPPPKKG